MFNKRNGYRVLSLLLVAGITFGGFELSSKTANAAQLNQYGLQTNIKDGNILHCFDWTYQEIIDEIPNIANAGFTSVQTSPAQPANCSIGGIWYELYQPNGFYVGDAGLGSESDLKRLCQEADKYGIKIVVDVVANHLAGNHNNIDGSLKDYQYWHNLGEGIDYNNRYEITHKDIGMPDINSEHSNVQYKVKNYIQQLKADGVDGIRWDAAKHISLPSEQCGFWSTVIDKSMFNYGEILDQPVCGNDGYANSLMSEYTDYMSVSDSIYSATVMGAIKDGSVPQDYGNWTKVNGIDDNEVVYFAETHDTYANHTSEGAWTKYIDQNKVDRAYAIVGSKANSSALYFSRPYATGKTDIKVGAKGSTHFTSKEVAAVNKLHNKCAGEKEYYKASGNVAIVARQSGATLVLGSGNNQNVNVENPGSTLASGTYKDVVSGSTFYVSGSNISGYVGSTGIAVLLKDVGPTPTPTPTPTPNPPIENEITVYFSNNVNWDKVYVYTWGGSDATGWPGKEATYVKKNEYNESVYSAKIPKDAKGLIFSDGNGHQTVDINSGFVDGLGYYISGNSGNKSTVGTYDFF